MKTSANTFLKLALLGLLTLISAPTAEAVLHDREQRTFTSTDGQKLEAILDHYNTEKKMVTLRLPNGQKPKLPLTRFSEEDQKYILDWRSDYDASFVRVNFYGNRIEGGRIVFMLDSSGSMKGNRWKKLTINMKSTLSQLNNTAEFNIIIFGSSARVFKPDLVKASDATIEEANKWLEAVHPEGGTSFSAAVQAAAPMKKASVYALLSDGYLRNRNEIYEAIRNNMRKNEVDIRVFTVSYYSNDEGALSLKDLADTFNGSYVRR